MKTLGELNEARKSLELKFTENELIELINMFWFSDGMQSIRQRLDKMENLFTGNVPVNKKPWYKAKKP